ncbi:hypothetical protein JIN84_04385 [Luteolibacter yonseiensis]|uniref:HEAT repeat domain-containing protein n=1 Tax=Luteolibacter yonseiensis TaxID=1144680 RepID=A0A934VAY5_9BACT|nr:HEAT repeat domain-containing protein [Luteolibacter yonseiensis]MBK1814839.1 hypothetical protein [Luteolibacter yonseiensis]
MTRSHATLLAGLAVLAATAIVISRGLGPSGDPGRAARAGAVESPLPAAKKSPRPPSRAIRISADEIPAPTQPPHPAGDEENLDWITQRVSDLNELAWFEDEASLRQILGELKNPLREIREAALEATKTFGSTAAIPTLSALAEETPDPVEQKTINEVIEYLKVPPMIDEDGDVTEGN